MRMKNILMGYCLPLLMALTAGGLAAKAQDGGAAAVVLGDERTEAYFPLLEGRRIAVFSNHTGMVGGKHLVYVLADHGFSVRTIFSPEHGFSGTADAGAAVGSSHDERTGARIVSLYGGGSNALNAATMGSFDVLLIDIQDVGLRFYTYYITMCRLLSACAESGKEVVLLDRPNPNGHLVDGPVLDMKHKSGVGGLPVPVLHGMTLGELALMANDRGWLDSKKRCRLTVIECLNYTHSTLWQLPVAPSPNLPNMTAVYLYASLCYFEATPVSVGRGTDLPFQIYGHPQMEGCSYSFTPRSRQGAQNPPQKDRLCHGVNLSTLGADSIVRKGVDLTYVVDAYRNLSMGDRFFTPFFEKLIGVDYVRQMIERGCSADEIRSRWQADVEQFRKDRKPYLLYEDAKEQ